MRPLGATPPRAGVRHSKSRFGVQRRSQKCGLFAPVHAQRPRCRARRRGAALILDVRCVPDEFVEPVAHEGVGAHVRRLLLGPPERIRLRVMGEATLEFAPGPRVEFLDADDRHLARP